MAAVAAAAAAGSWYEGGTLEWGGRYALASASNHDGVSIFRIVKLGAGRLLYRSSRWLICGRGLRRIERLAHDITPTARSICYFRNIDIGCMIFVKMISRRFKQMYSDRHLQCLYRRPPK